MRTISPAVFALLVGCSAGTTTDPVPARGAAAGLVAEVSQTPFALQISHNGAPILQSLPTQGLPLATDALSNLADLSALLDPATLTEAHGVLDLDGRYGTLGFAVDLRLQAQTPLASYGLFTAVPLRWFHATSAQRLEENHYRVATNDPLGRSFDLLLSPHPDGHLSVTATLSDPTAVSAVGWSFQRPDDEQFLGFGERSDAVNQTGNFVETWAEEGPFSAGALSPYTAPLLGDDWQGPHPVPGTNFPLPWFVSSAGYGFLLDSFAYNAFRLNRPGQWNVATREPTLKFTVYAGPTPAQALDRYTQDQGRQPPPAEWFFGPWYQPLGSAEFRQGLITDWRDWDVPVTVAQTYAHYLPCAAQFGRRDALAQEVARYHANGYRVTTYVNSFVCTQHPRGAYEEGVANDYFIKNALGQPYQIPYAAFLDSSSVVIDFTNPAAASWWQGLISEALEDGYDGWMEDFGEYVPPDAVMADGSNGIAHHNEYCTRYHQASHALTWPLKGRDFAQFVRCGNIGTAPYARIVWGGDPSEDDSQADGLAASLSQGLSMGLSGIGYWGSDIGGFHSLFTGGRTPAEVLIRWIGLGAFSGIMRMQEDGYEIPTVQGERVHIWEPEIRPFWRRYTKLRTQLFPYIWEAAQEYQRSGMPLMRHLSLVVPQDPQAFGPWAETSFFFGPDLLVAPILQAEQRARDVYLPAGDWCAFWPHVSYDETSGAFSRRDGPGAIAGGQVINSPAPLGEIPLFVRAGARLPMLPAETDTLTDIGTAPGLVSLASARQRQGLLRFGPNCER